MDNNYTDINVVLDASTSMAPVVNETLAGFNTFLKEQKEAPGKATMTLVQFNTYVKPIYTAMDLKEAEPLNKSTYVIGGFTCLLDAICMTIVDTGKRLAAMPEEKRPGKVLFVIQTDGDENASRQYTREHVAAMIKEQTEKYNWDFIFLGANQDAIQAGQSMGFLGGNSMTYAHNSAGTVNAFSSISANTIAYRGGDLSKKAAFFENKDRDDQLKAGA